jgi:glutamyl-tRNA reductase
VSDPEPTLFVVGATHHTTPLEWREKLALGPEKLPEFRQRLAALPGLQEFAVLNTCNRIEFYGVADGSETIDELRRTFCGAQGIELEAFRTLEMCRTGPEVISHLTSVSAGLESQLVGENEIFGQVKDAYADAQAARSVGPWLHKVFQKTFQAAKQVRTQTAITEGQVSIANVAVDLATTIFGDLRDARVLLAGAGEVGEAAAKAFRSRGTHDLTVSSRTMEHAMAVARQLDARALPFEKLAHHIADFDVIACATAAPGSILSHEVLSQAMRARPAAPLFLIDFALPRDIDPSAGEIDNVYLYNLDDLAKISEENRAARVAEVERARGIILAKSAVLWESLRLSRRSQN